MEPKSSRGIKRPHSTSDFTLGENEISSTSINHSRSHGTQQSQSQLTMRRLAGTPRRGGNSTPHAGNPTALTPPQYTGANRIHRQPAPKARRSPLPFTYGSEVSLNPAMLSALPEPTAVQQIKMAIPAIPRLMTGHVDIAKMISMLIANAMTDLPATVTKSDHSVHVHRASKTDTPGADFDLLFNSLSESGLVGAKNPTTPMRGHGTLVNK
ncbi:uncharacterized protein A1O9_02883 [Exophiala aquamarina CBS 119918]|uniref:Uncharacterized protein n=1 Tax=Exophiala aquamarina CBS 119918 TaxID=1182545 RepID=A0A072PPS4_9EURO|nr:uncharacterized protein A1O9_02883 [Exophiala aquamarina CBS 119918]KEF61318.1 hypothetical protein A1O9_02883 [Exophiala aquamarina CBS 119918]